MNCHNFVARSRAKFLLIFVPLTSNYKKHFVEVIEGEPVIISKGSQTFPTIFIKALNFFNNNFKMVHLCVCVVFKQTVYFIILPRVHILFLVTVSLAQGHSDDVLVSHISSSTISKAPELPLPGIETISTVRYQQHLQIS